MKIITGVIVLIMVSTSFAGECGDVNNDANLNLMDVAYIINHLYRAGPEFICETGTDECGDVNSDNKLNLLDAAYIINFLYRGGPAPFCGTITDIDGNTYEAVKIGDQWWMAENLKVTHYRNGEAIANIYVYNNDINNVTAYGRLYNWNAVNDSRNIAPIGWHIPSDAEWKQLEMYLGLSEAEADINGWRGIYEGGELKESGTAHWLSPNTGATNESGFTALPGGFGYSGIFERITYGAYFWSSTVSGSDDAWYRYLECHSSAIYRTIGYRLNCFSVRCVKD